MKQAGIYFNNKDYIEINMETKTLTEIANGETIEYRINNGGRKLLYENPDTTIQMTSVVMFNESELEGYDYIEFTVTDTSGAFEVKELCEIAPLKEHSGQFVISFPNNNNLFVRKIYRTNGTVKPSTSVYELGKTTEDKTQCIVKCAYAVRY